MLCPLRPSNFDSVNTLAKERTQKGNNNNVNVPVSIIIYAHDYYGTGCMALFFSLST